MAGRGASRAGSAAAARRARIRARFMVPLWATDRIGRSDRRYALSSSHRRNSLLACALLVALASPALAQKKTLALEDLTADPPLAGRAVTGIAWLPDGRHFSYVVRRGAGEEAAASELVVEDARTGSKAPAIPAQG